MPILGGVGSASLSVPILPSSQSSGTMPAVSSLGTPHVSLISRRLLPVQSSIPDPGQFRVHSVSQKANEVRQNLRYDPDPAPSGRQHFPRFCRRQPQPCSSVNRRAWARWWGRNVNRSRRHHFLKNYCAAKTSGDSTMCSKAHCAPLPTLLRGSRDVSVSM